LGNIWEWDNITVDNTVNNFKIRSCIYRIRSDRTGGKYEYGTIQLIELYLVGQVQSTVQYKANNNIHIIITTITI
jgi:hypothetical protein